MKEYRAFFDRDPNSIDGAFTLQYFDHTTGQKVVPFHRLPARSGQRGWTKTDWTTAKSPIPFHEDLWLSTNSVPLQMEPKGTPFFPIGSSPKNIGTISGPKGYKRTNVGLHLENQYPGSAGCIVLLHDTPARHKGAWSLFEYLTNIDEPFIRLTVL